MDRIDIDFSPGQRQLIDEQIAGGSYADLNAYVADALDRDTKRLAQEKLETMLLEGLKGKARTWTTADSARLRAIARGEI